MRGTLHRFRRVAHVGGLAALCALLGAASAQATWEPAQPIDNGGTGYGATQSSALAVAPNSPTSALFFQSAPGPTSGSTVIASFMVRRGPGPGTSWSAPAQLTTPAGQASSSQGFSLAAAGGGPLGNGGTVAMFPFQPNNGTAETLSTSWPASASAPSQAVTALCSSAVPPECATGALGAPQVAFDETGNGYGVGGAVSSTGTNDLLFARFDATAGSWGPAQVIAHGVTPQLAVDPAGNVVVTYTQQDSSAPPGIVVSHEYVIRELVGQSSFSAPQQISGPNTVAQGPVVMDGAGTATAVFMEDTVPPNIFQGTQAPVVQAVRWPLGQAAPGQETQISGSPSAEGLQSSPAVAVDPQGRVTAAWSGLTPTGGNIYAAQFGGSWAAPDQVSPGSGRVASSPFVAADAGGTVTVAYTDNAPTNNDGDAKVAFKPLAASWSTPISVRSTATGTGTVQSASARVVVAARGQVDVTFIQQLNGTSRLFATRLVDNTPPSITIAVPQDGATYNQGATVVADYSCADEPGGSGLASCQGTVPAGQPIDTSTPGAMSFTVTARDNAGNTASKTVSYTVRAGPPPVDRTPPSITIAVPQDGGTYTEGATVVADYSCADEPGGSGLASCHGTVPTGQPIDTRTPGTKSFTVTASDNAGNTSAKTVSYTVRAAPPPADRTPPSITIAAPQDGARYTKGQLIHAQYRCADPDSPVQTCRGAVPAGGLIDTTTPGRHTFSVVAQDPSGNTAAKTVSYTVVSRLTLAAIRVSVRPGGAAIGHRVTFHFTVQACRSGRCQRLAGVLVTFAGHRARTNRRGLATLRVSFKRPGRYRVKAHKPGFVDGGVTVSVRGPH